MRVISTTLREFQVVHDRNDNLEEGRPVHRNRKETALRVERYSSFARPAWRLSILPSVKLRKQFAEDRFCGREHSLSLVDDSTILDLENSVGQIKKFGCRV